MFTGLVSVPALTIRLASKFIVVLAQRDALLAAPSTFGLLVPLKAPVASTVLV